MRRIIKIHPEEEMQAGLQGISKWSAPTETKAEVTRFVEGLALGKVSRGRRVSAAAQLKYVHTLKVPLLFFNKPTEQLSEQDVENFEKALSTDQILSKQKAKPYSHSSKIGIKKALKIFLRWRLGEVRARQLVGWLDTREHHKTPDYLKELDIEKLFLACRTAEQRFTVAVLFDSGARAEEFINIRYEDIQFPEGSGNFVKIALKEEYSKTKGRTVSLYWKNSLQAVKEYVNARIAQGIKPQEPVFSNTYGAMRMFLRRLGKSVLQKLVHPHLLRHSSATHYANKMNRQELCYRYGWKFSSNMPDVYISRAGLENKQLDEKFTQTEMGSLKDDLVQTQLREKIKDDRIKKLEEKLEIIEQNLFVIADVIRQRPPIKKVERALQRKAEEATH